MDFSLNEEQRAIKDAISKICNNFKDDYWLNCDRTASFPHEFAKAFCDAGWFGTIFPESAGGAGLGMTEASIIMLEVGKLGLAACSSIHMNMFGAQPIVKFGTEEQIQLFLPPLISGQDRACFAVTEPDAGLNTTRITTFAKRDGDHYVVNGRKVWTSTAQHANKILLLTRTKHFDEGKKPTDGMTLFYTDLDRSKIDVRSIDKLGRSAVDSNELFIEDLRIPKSDLIGEEGKGFSYLMHGLNTERIIVAAGFLGAARSALERATLYAKDRIVFDRPIGKNQSIQHPLAESWIQIASAELMIFKGASLYDSNQPCGPEVNAAKYLAAEAFFQTSTRAVRTHGGYGYAKEFHVERYFRESILSLIAPVSQELVLCHIAERVLGLPKSY